MRKEFEMTQEQLNELMKACKAVPYMIIGGVEPRSPQENANAAWAKLGNELGFNYTTVNPVTGRGPTFFTAETTE